MRVRRLLWRACQPDFAWQRGPTAAVARLANYARAGRNAPLQLAAATLPPPSCRQAPDQAFPENLGVSLLGLAGGLAALAIAKDSSLAHAETDASLTAEEARTVGIFEQCSGSVVHINTFQEVEVWQGFRTDVTQMRTGSGSGFVWDRQHVVTNYHVIKDAQRASIVMADQTSREASLVGTDPDCDIAVLRIQGGPPLEPLQRGGSNSLRVGQRVLAIGNPFGLDHTLTSGIVSGLGRELKGVSGRTIFNIIQTDAAINPGNSGGPLLDGHGRLIGMNTMIWSKSGEFAGVGFAIPVDTVARFVQQIIRFGKTVRPFLGVDPLPDHRAVSFSRMLVQRGHPPVEGVVAKEVEHGSPAERAGLQNPFTHTAEGFTWDEIHSIDGKRVRGVESLLDAVEQHEVGDVVDVEYYRRSERSTGDLHVCKVRLGERWRLALAKHGPVQQKATLVLTP